jgi:RND family efflux transporter MFP subunit
VRLETEETSQEKTSHRDPSLRGLPRRRLPLVLAACIALAVVAALIYYARSRGTVKETAAAPAAEKATGKVAFLMEQQWLIRMKLAQAESQSVAPQIASTGRVIPASGRQAIIAPPVGGLVATAQLPRVGQQVARGQTITMLRQTLTASESAQIAASNAQLQIESARLESERRRLTEKLTGTRAEVEAAKREYERSQRLYARQAVSKQQVDEDESRLKIAEANYNAGQRELEALNARGSLTAVIPTQKNFAVTAPISGTVVEVHKALGEQVAPGEAIIEIINLETVWVEAPIFERDLARLGNKTRAVFTTSAAPETEFSGSIVNIGAVVDEQSRTATVIFEVPNKGRALRIGMQANVRLDAGERVEAVIVPKEAVLEHEGKKIVYVLLSGEEFERREVTLGDEYGEKVAVLAGLKAGERVVTQGAYQLKLQELRPADAGAHSHET